MEGKSLGSMLRRLSRDSRESRESKDSRYVVVFLLGGVAVSVLMGRLNRDEHDMGTARRHVAQRVQLSELIVGVLDLDRLSHPTYTRTHSHSQSQPLNPIHSSSKFEYEHEHGREDDVPYTRVMASTVKKRPALRDVDFSLLDDSYEVV